jgi:hypothetical protein
LRVNMWRKGCPWLIQHARVNWQWQWVPLAFADLVWLLDFVLPVPSPHFENHLHSHFKTYFLSQNFLQTTNTTSTKFCQSQTLNISKTSTKNLFANLQNLKDLLLSEEWAIPLKRGRTTWNELAPRDRPGTHASILGQCQKKPCPLIQTCGNLVLAIVKLSLGRKEAEAPRELFPPV